MEHRPEFNARPRVFTAAMVLASMLTGCATTPDTTINYYLAKSSVKFTVLRTIACNTRSHVVMSHAVTPVVSHSADKADKESRLEIDTSALKGAFSDADLLVTFYDDGRLKSLNTSTTGQGEPVFKTAITIATLFLALEGSPTPYPSECKLIAKIGEGKPVTLKYGGMVDLTNGELQTIPPEAASEYYHRELISAIGPILVQVGDRNTPKRPIEPETDSEAASAEPSLSSNSSFTDSRSALIAREPALVRFELVTPKSSEPLWSGSLPVAQLGIRYELPIPNPGMFGKRQVAATFAESGSLTSIHFLSNTGAGQALNVVNSGLTGFAPKTTAEKAAEVQAEADLIAQQQRLVRCLAEPEACI